MISIPLAIIWLLFGAYTLWKPPFLKKRFQKKGIKLARRYAILISCLATGSLFTLVWDLPGFWVKIGGLACSLAVWLYVFRMFRKVKKHIKDLGGDVSDEFLKHISLTYIGIGSSMLVANIVSRVIAE